MDTRQGDGVQIGTRSTGVYHNNLCRERIEECLRQEEDNPHIMMRFEACQEEEATGLYGAPEFCRVWAREDKDAINFKTPLVEGPEWKDVGWRATKKKSNKQIIRSRTIKEERNNKWNIPLFENQTIIIELWYIPRKLIENVLLARSKRLFEVSEQEPQIKRLESEPKQG